MMSKQLSGVLFMLLTVASAGLLMRSWGWANNLPITFFDLRQAHSHMAFLGWIFPAVMLLYNRVFAPTLNRSVDRFLFWVIIIINVLMFGAFLKYGYTGPSIVLLSIHTMLAFLYAWEFLRNLSSEITGGKRLLVISSIVMMSISFLGPLAIPIIKNMGGGPRDMKLAIHFYLHFQYNAFFVLTVLALWARNLKQVNITKPIFLVVIGICGTYFLTVKDALNSELLIAVGAGAAIVQLIGMLWLVKKQYEQEAGVSGIMQLIPVVAIGSILLKCSIQAMANWIPELTVGDGLHFWVIAFLHLMFLGAITPYLLLEFVKLKLLPQSTIISVALGVFLLGVLITQTVLGLQGAAVYLASISTEYLPKILQLGSFLIWVSVLVFFVISLFSFNRKSA